MPEHNKLYRLKQVLELTGLSRSSLYSLIKTGKFPEQINIGLRAVAWRARDVIDWIDSRIRISQA